jgi:hypothetical protein
MSQEYEDYELSIPLSATTRIDTSLIVMYLEGRDDESSAKIFEKNKEYYLVSIDKTIARLELTRTRVKLADLSEEDVEMLDDKISNSVNWLNDLKKDIEKTKDKSEFISVVSYKKWHTIKLLSNTIEGYYISRSIQNKINRIIGNLSESAHKMQLRSAKKHINVSEKIFAELLDLSDDSDLINAEEMRIKAYKELSTSQDILKTKFSQFSR